MQWCILQERNFAIAFCISFDADRGRHLNTSFYKAPTTNSVSSRGFFQYVELWAGLLFIGESLFTFFASLAYVPLFLLELQNRLFWILKEPLQIKRLLEAYTRVAVINSVPQANLEIAEQINQGQPHTQSP